MTKTHTFEGAAHALRAHRLGGDANIAAVAALIGDEARAAMLLALVTGRPLSASELAALARVRPQTASSHLAKLVRGSLLHVERQGRFRYYRVANPDVAAAIEALGVIAPTKRVRALGATIKQQALRLARTCYDHLAGRLGVALFQALVERDALCELDRIDPSQRKRRSALGAVALGPRAAAVFGDLGIDLEELRSAHRQFAPACLDWTETEPHLGGSLGAALCCAFFENDWCRHRPRLRAVTLTDRGRHALRERFGIELDRGS